MPDLIIQNKSVAETMNSLISQPAIKARFEEILGRRAPQFISSIISIVNADQNLLQAFKDNPMSIIQVSLKAAIYDLSLGNERGLAYILPFKNYKTGKSEAAFVIGYKGYIQLALRTRRYKYLGASDVRQGELKSYDRLFGILEIETVENPEERLNLPIIGYAAGFQTHDGFQKSIFKTTKEIEMHEQQHRRGQYQSSVWKNHFDAMAKKTVLLMLLKTYAPTNSVEIRAAEIDDWFASQTAENNQEDFLDDAATNINPETGEILD